MVDRQIPWRLTRKSIPAGALSIILGVIAGFLFPRLLPNGGENALLFSSIVGVVFALCAWLAWCAFSWHLELGRKANGPYLLRYSGLVFGVAMWSAQSTQFFKLLDNATGWEAHAFHLIFVLFLPAPFALWGGLVFRYAFDFIFGSRASRP